MNPSKALHCDALVQKNHMFQESITIAMRWFKRRLIVGKPLHSFEAQGSQKSDDP
jgi:hypothetical protein